MTLLHTSIRSERPGLLSLKLSLNEDDHGDPCLRLSITRQNLDETLFTPDELAAITAQLWACLSDRRLTGQKQASLGVS